MYFEPLSSSTRKIWYPCTSFFGLELIFIRRKQIHKLIIFRTLCKGLFLASTLWKVSLMRIFRQRRKLNSRTLCSHASKKSSRIHAFDFLLTDVKRHLHLKNLFKHNSMILGQHFHFRKGCWKVFHAESHIFHQLFKNWPTYLNICIIYDFYHTLPRTQACKIQTWNARIAWIMAVRSQSGEFPTALPPN